MNSYNSYADGNHKTPDEFTTSQVSYWELDEASGTRVDNNANSNDLTDNNTVGNISDSIHGTVADFEDSNSEYLSITDASQTGLDITSDLTISAWINVESLPSVAGNRYTIVGKARSAGNRAYRFFVETTDAISVQISADGTVVTGATTTKTVSVDTWYHVAVVFDDSENTVQIYFNGVKSGNVATHTGSIFNSNEDFVIGVRSTGAVDQLFDGKIHDVGIWSVALTPSQIALLAGKKHRIRTSN